MRAAAVPVVQAPSVIPMTSTVVPFVVGVAMAAATGPGVAKKKCKKKKKPSTPAMGVVETGQGTAAATTVVASVDGSVSVGVGDQVITTT